MSYLKSIRRFLITGFPSPWRWLRRRYWFYRFNRMAFSHQCLAEAFGVDPNTLIARGEL